MRKTFLNPGKSKEPVIRSNLKFSAHGTKFLNILAKAQHGVCKINQLPWEYDDKLEKMKRSLTE